MATSSPQEKDMQVNGEVADNVHTPVAHQEVSYGESTEGTDPLLNLRFKTEEEAYDYYKDYAEKIGFKIRKSTSNKDTKGIVRSRKICCSRAGFKRDRPDSKAKWRWEDTRTGCNANIYLKLENDGMYTITRHQADHNHKCTPYLTQAVDTFVVASKDKITTRTRYKNLMHTSVRLSNMASKNQKAYEMTLDVMNYLMKKLTENCNVASQCEPPNEMDAEPRNEFDILGMIDDGRILCSNDSASIPSQVMGVGQKEKGLKGGKREKNALEKASQNKSTKAKDPKDSTSSCQPTNEHLSTLSMDHPLMNQQEQHLQGDGLRKDFVQIFESVCKWCYHVMTADDLELEDWVYHQLEDTTHLLHGVVNTNGYGHLL